MRHEPNSPRELDPRKVFASGLEMELPMVKEDQDRRKFTPGAPSSGRVATPQTWLSIQKLVKSFQPISPGLAQHSLKSVFVQQKYAMHIE